MPCDIIMTAKKTRQKFAYDVLTFSLFSRGMLHKYVTYKHFPEAGINDGEGISMTPNHFFHYGNSVV